MNNHFISSQSNLSKDFNYDYQLHPNNLCAGLLVSIGLYVEHFGIKKSYNSFILNNHNMSQAIKNYLSCIPNIRAQGINAINIPHIKSFSSLIENTLKRPNGKSSIYLQKLLILISNLLGYVFIMLSENYYTTYGLINNQSITICLYNCSQGLFTIFPMNLTQINHILSNFYKFAPKRILTCGHPVSKIDKNSNQCELCRKTVYRLENNNISRVKSHKSKKICPDCTESIVFQCTNCSKSYCQNHIPSRKCDECGKHLKITFNQSLSPLSTLETVLNNSKNDEFKNIFQVYQDPLSKSSSIKKILNTFLSYSSIKELIISNLNPTKHINIIKTLQELITNDVKSELDEIANMISQQLDSDSNRLKAVQLSLLLSVRIIILDPIKIKLGPKNNLSSLWQLILSSERIKIRIKNPKSKKSKIVLTPRQQKINDKVCEKLKDFNEKLKKKELNSITLKCGCKVKLQNFIKNGCSEVGDFICSGHETRINKIEAELIEKFNFCNTNRCWKCGSVYGEKVKCLKCKFCFCESECSENGKLKFKVAGGQIKCPKCMNKLLIDGSRISIGMPKVGYYSNITQNNVLELLETDKSMNNCTICFIFPQSKNKLCRMI